VGDFRSAWVWFWPWGLGLLAIKGIADEGIFNEKLTANSIPFFPGINVRVAKNNLLHIQSWKLETKIFNDKLARKFPGIHLTLNISFVLGQIYISQGIKNKVNHFLEMLKTSKKKIK